jgi:2-phospho-L-lactate/phosphoenolpyruvate guanylyltransferase
MTPDGTLTWSLVIPVKVLAQAKSRLTGLPRREHAELVLAMVADTVAAAVAAPQVGAVVVVTDDPAVRDEVAGIGALALPDEPAAGLNDALAFGARQARARWPERGVAALAADLPALRPAELGLALSAAAAAGRAFVPDADGTGTTLYAAVPGTSFEPLFGEGSRARHRAAGLAELGLAGLQGLRRDVDTAAELLLAAHIGVGPRTAAVLARGVDWAQQG